jgi:hypothetical protein
MFAIVAVVVFLPILVISRIGESSWFAAAYAKHRRVTADESAGRTVLGSITLTFSALFGVLALASTALFLFGDVPWDIPSTAFLNCPWVFAAITATYASHSWTWTPGGVAWKGLFRSKEIKWSEVSTIYRYSSGRLLVVSSNGDKISCPADLIEKAKLDAAIARARPDIKFEIRFW